jgi:hypothetical protein
MGLAELNFAFIEKLEVHHRILTFDYPIGLDTNVDLADAVRALLGALGIKKTVFVGGLIYANPDIVKELFVEYSHIKGAESCFVSFDSLSKKLTFLLSMAVAKVGDNIFLGIIQKRLKRKSSVYLHRDRRCHY